MILGQKWAFCHSTNIYFVKHLVRNNLYRFLDLIDSLDILKWMNLLVKTIIFLKMHSLILNIIVAWRQSLFIWCFSVLPHISWNPTHRAKQKGKPSISDKVCFSLLFSSTLVPVKYVAGRHGSPDNVADCYSRSESEAQRKSKDKEEKENGARGKLIQIGANILKTIIRKS